MLQIKAKRALLLTMHSHECWQEWRAVDRQGSVLEEFEDLRVVDIERSLDSIDGEMSEEEVTLHQLQH